MKIIKQIAILFILIFWISATSNAQHHISGTIRQFSGEPIYLSAFSDSFFSIIDSTTTDYEGNFYFDTKLTCGMYQLSTQYGEKIFLIYNSQPIRLIANNSNNLRDIDFINSEDNQDWNLYTQVRDGIFYLQDLLKPVIKEYPNNLDFYQETKDEYIRLQNSLKEISDSLISNHNNLATKYIQSDRPLVVDINLTFAEQRKYIIEHYFDEIDFTDTMLLYSNVLTTKMIDFLSLTQNQELNSTQAQINFIMGLEHILKLASAEIKTYTFVVQYMLQGFSQLGLLTVVDYLSELPELNSDCLDLENKIKLEKIIAPYQKIKIDAEAPPIMATSIEGESFDLYSLESDFTVLFFWSVSCPHCLEMMSDLSKFIKQHTDITFVTVMIGNQSPILNNFFQTEKIAGYHICDNLGWESPIVKDYNVFGTPTLFILNEDKTIVQKPFNMDEFHHFFKQKLNK